MEASQESNIRAPRGSSVSLAVSEAAAQQPRAGHTDRTTPAVCMPNSDMSQTDDGGGYENNTVVGPRKACHDYGPYFICRVGVDEVALSVRTIVGTTTPPCNWLQVEPDRTHSRPECRPRPATPRRSWSSSPDACSGIWSPDDDPGSCCRLGRLRVQLQAELAGAGCVVVEQTLKELQERVRK